VKVALVPVAVSSHCTSAVDPLLQWGRPLIAHPHAGLSAVRFRVGPWVGALQYTLGTWFYSLVCRSVNHLEREATLAFVSHEGSLRQKRGYLLL
jgi:hypothetical protein